MRIATFNANSIRSRMPILVDWLAKQSPDILCVQETKVQDPDFPIEPIQDAGYEVVFKGQKSYNGVAILSKHKPDEVASGFTDKGPADDTRFIRARFGKLWIVNTYVPQGREIDHEMYEYKQAWFKRLRTFFDKEFKTSDLLLWTGDLNVAREPIDVSDPEKKKKHVCYHADVRKVFEKCLEWGFVDIFRKYHPEAGQFSFYDYRQFGGIESGKGWRIDYILVSPALAKLATDSFIDLEPRKLPKPSDHTFMVADFDL